MKWQFDPSTRSLLDQLSAANLPAMNELTPSQARQAMLDGRIGDIDPPSVATVRELHIPGPGGPIPIRCYYPPGTETAELAALLYFHGGGFVIGDLDTHDILCRRLCRGAGVLVASVDYRLAPEHRYPAAVEDALAAFAWLSEHAEQIGADSQRLAVGGDSAGGTLAAVVAQHARDHSITLRAQALLYPVVDLAGQYPSQLEHAAIHPIPKSVLDWFWAHYLGPQGNSDLTVRQHPWASPIRTDNFAGLAPAFILTAGLDPLRDEAMAYAERLAAAGVETVYQCAMGTIHGFLRLGRLIPAADECVASAATFLKTRLLSPTNDSRPEVP